MPPKDNTNAIDGTLYFEDENGELKPITVIRDAELTTDTDLEDIIPEEYRLSTAHEFNFSLGNTPWRDIKLYKLIHINNYRRIHGLRPIRRKIQRHKPEISLFAVKCMRGGFGSNDLRGSVCLSNEDFMENRNRSTRSIRCNRQDYI